MATKYEAHVEPWHDLQHINEVVLPDLENNLGPLVDIAADSNSTVLTFQYGDPPDKCAVLAAQVEGRVEIPPEATLIDQGVVFVKGELVLCAAYREVN